jgi:hypothetical protein
MARKRLNLKSVIPGLDGSTKLMDAIERVVMQEWKAESRSLGETRQVYRDNIVVSMKDPNKMQITLRGMVPNIVEQGMGPGGVGTYGAYDIRKFIKFDNEDHPNYVNVRFGHTGVSAGTGTVAKQVKKLAMSRSKPPDIGGFIYGKKTRTNIGPRLGRGFAPVRRNPTTGKRHSTDFLAGMIRSRSVDASARSGTQYATFRRLSKNGKPWISSGVRPRRYARKVVQALPGLIGPTIAALFRSSR